jgi:hypothetical protein
MWNKIVILKVVFSFLYEVLVPERNICHCSYGHYTFIVSIQVLLIYYLKHTCLCIFIRSTFMLFNSSVLNLKMRKGPISVYIAEVTHVYEAKRGLKYMKKS